MGAQAQPSIEGVNKLGYWIASEELYGAIFILSIPHYLSRVGECCISVLLRSSRNVLCTTKLYSPLTLRRVGTTAAILFPSEVFKAHFQPI